MPLPYPLPIPTAPSEPMARAACLEDRAPHAFTSDLQLSCPRLANTALKPIQTFLLTRLTALKRITSSRVYSFKHCFFASFHSWQAVEYRVFKL